MAPATITSRPIATPMICVVLTLTACIDIHSFCYGSASPAIRTGCKKPKSPFKEILSLFLWHVIVALYAYIALHTAFFDKNGKLQPGVMPNKSGRPTT
jgi:hypothetical protein